MVCRLCWVFRIFKDTHLGGPWLCHHPNELISQCVTLGVTGILLNYDSQAEDLNSERSEYLGVWGRGVAQLVVLECQISFFCGRTGQKWVDKNSGKL